VSVNQRRAIARLRELMMKGELTEQNMPSTGGAPDAVRDIQLPPLTIAPIQVPAVDTVSGSEGSRRRSER